MAETAALEHQYRFVDDIPEIARERLQIREAAEALLDERKQQQESGQLLPLPVDALSTAKKVLAAEARHGEDSQQRAQMFNGLMQDSTLLVAEWNSKLDAEVFPELRHDYDAETKGHYSHGLLIRQMTENGIVPMEESPEDEARRINEHIEEYTPSIARRLGHMATSGEALITLSQCTDKAEADYADDFKHGRPHRGYGGYVPEINKIMIRRHSFAPDSEDRLEQQIALPGEYLQHHVLIEALGKLGLDGSNMDKTQLHGEQILTTASLQDIAKHLDSVASEHWGTPIFMGKPVGKNVIKDYAAFEQEALRRQEGLHDLAAKTARYVLDLAADPYIDDAQAPAKVEKFVKLLLLEYYEDKTEQAAIAFDRQTADGLQRVNELKQAGDMQAAIELFEQIEQAAPGGGYCGAGSCGLEAVRLVGKELDQLKKDLGYKPGETLTKDSERACGKCHKKGELYYSHRATGPVKKICYKCNARQ